MCFELKRMIFWFYMTIPIKWSLTVQVRSQCPTLSAIISAVVLDPGERLTVSVWWFCAVKIWPWKWTEWMSTLFKIITKIPINYIHTFLNDPSTPRYFDIY